MRTRKAKRNPPMTEAKFRETIRKFIEEEQAGIDAYKQLLLSIPINYEFNQIRRIISAIIRDEENHEKALLRILYI